MIAPSEDKGDGEPKELPSKPEENLPLADWPNWPARERELDEGEPRVARFYLKHVPWED